MASRYKQVALDDASPGMILSDDLLDNHGNVLLRGGLELSASTLAALRRHRITALPIACDEEVSTEDEEAKRARYEMRLNRLFRKPANDAEDANGLLEQYVRYFRLGEPQ